MNVIKFNSTQHFDSAPSNYLGLSLPIRIKVTNKKVVRLTTNEIIYYYPEDEFLLIKIQNNIITVSNRDKTEFSIWSSECFLDFVIINE